MTNHIFVNGEKLPLAETAAGGGGAPTVAGLLARMNLRGRKIAVEKNGAIVPKGKHDSEPLTAGDSIEIVTAVGGG